MHVASSTEPITETLGPISMETEVSPNEKKSNESTVQDSGISTAGTSPNKEENINKIETETNEETKQVPGIEYFLKNLNSTKYAFGMTKMKDRTFSVSYLFIRFIILRPVERRGCMMYHTTET